MPDIVLLAGGIGITPIWCRCSAYKSSGARGSSITPAARVPIWPFYALSNRCPLPASISTTKTAARCKGQTILQVLLDAGVDVDYSCELGICGACEQRVISGIPEHRDAILTEQEHPSNARVMICCAGCKSERLVLDI